MACGKPAYKGDGFCDDENNNAACAYDEGDCCGDSVKKSYCNKVGGPDYESPEIEYFDARMSILSRT